MRLTELHVNTIDLKKFEADCKPWLEAIRGTTQLAWHGTYASSIKDWSIRDMKYRDAPRDTPRDVHDAVNDFLEQKFGYPCRNWLFVSGNMQNAKIYGDAFVIFPIGEFKYLWSPEMEELTAQLDHFVHEARYVKHIDDLDTRKAYAKKELLEFIKKPGVWKFNEDIKTALKARLEIQLDCEKFYIMNVHETFWDTVRPFLMNEGYMK